MRYLLVLLALAAVGCSNEVLVTPLRLTQGGGGAGINSSPDLDILVLMGADCTFFNPGDLMRVLVDGVDRTAEVALGGDYALLRLSPPPPGSTTVELFRRTGPLLDSFTWLTAPYTGPTLASVAPAIAQVGTQVLITGTGFGTGLLRVFFGGVEGTVDTSTPITITATVPLGALPGLVFVLVDADAAVGLVNFQPLDLLNAPVPASTEPRVFAIFPGRGAGETVAKFYGVAFNEDAIPSFGGEDSTRVFGVETVTLLGDILSGFAVVDPDSPPGAGGFLFRQDGVDSNELPFTVE